MLINKLTTAFGDHSSLLPLFTKDIVNSTGMTAFSYNAGGKIEAKDRFDSIHRWNWYISLAKSIAFTAEIELFSIFSFF